MPRRPLFLSLVLLVGLFACGEKDTKLKVTGIEVTLDRSVGGCGTCTVPADCVQENLFHLTKDGVSVAGTNHSLLEAPRRRG